MSNKTATQLSCDVRTWLNLFDLDRTKIQVFQNGHEWVPIGDELPVHFVALIKDRCLRWIGDQGDLDFELWMNTTDEQDRAMTDQAMRELQEDYPNDGSDNQ